MTDPDADWQGGHTEGEATLNSPFGAKNIASWALPLDEFVTPYGNLDNYADQLLLASCLGEQNIDWPVPWQDVEEPASPVIATSGARLFDLEIAKKYGFRTNIEFSKSAKLWETFISYTPTESGFQKAFDECLADIRSEYPINNVDDQMFVRGLMHEAQEDAFLDPRVQEAAARWRSCMDPQGFGQLPDNPSAFPSPELLEELGAVPPVKSLEPSPRELEVAVAHATCLDSSGFSEASYDTEWALQETAIERERTKLDGIRNEVQAREAAVQAIIAANAPKA